MRTKLAFVLSLLAATTYWPATCQEPAPPVRDPVAQAEPGVMPHPVAQSEPPLTNADLVKLHKLGLGDEVLIAKINQAPAVDFKLDTGALAELKGPGLGQEVIVTMLKRATPPARDSFPAPPVEAVEPPPVKLMTTDGDFELYSLDGSPSSTYAWATVLLFLDYPGSRAEVRITDPLPKLLVRCRSNPVSRFFLVKADPDWRKRTRSVKVGRAGAYSYSRVDVPDSDWTIPFKAKEEMPFLWRLTPEMELKPGEYGLFVAESGELFDFGVDKVEKKQGK